MMKNERRKAIKLIGAAGTGLALFGGMNILNSCSPSAQKGSAEEEAAELFFNISLAQWSLNRSIFGKSRELSWEDFGKRLKSDPDSLLQGDMAAVDFPLVASRDFGINAVEYVNTFYFSKGTDEGFWKQMKIRCDDLGVSSQLIMCDAEGSLGDLDEAARIQSVENHYKWINAAKILGCHSIRVNAAGNGTADEVRAAAVDGLGRLTEYGAQNGIHVIVENHGGYSSDGKWLSNVISQVGSEYCGTLPDFGNFCIERGADGCAHEYDRYQGVKDLIPFAQGLSAKAHDFDAEGNETHTDFAKMMQIAKDAGFTGYIGVEYEGDVLSEADGIKATKALLKKVGRV
ncbi:sugar phosphate isomerase/epimerase [Gilvimarinus agarilyticus]|uniref:sugar phosphate isomerase/epimerase family protein n=1 Tax=Reichenbachiella agariperforans TaxID=156994 RepID=UPI001C094F0D|nr:sugar phosphate isomerase/epimerase family protein [Reichenbachiella agariperforans]MBU2884731.1 sugar phosphate isomerase/epimerase [Gilvimarinus agarilyticus]